MASPELYREASEGNLEEEKLLDEEPAFPFPSEYRRSLDGCPTWLPITGSIDFAEHDHRSTLSIASAKTIPFETQLPYPFFAPQAPINNIHFNNEPQHHKRFPVTWYRFEVDLAGGLTDKQIQFVGDHFDNTHSIWVNPGDTEEGPDFTYADGHTSFTHEIPPHKLINGMNEFYICVEKREDLLIGKQTRNPGIQDGPIYLQSSGIGPMGLLIKPKTHINILEQRPDLDQGLVHMNVAIKVADGIDPSDLTFTTTIYAGDKPVGQSVFTDLNQSLSGSVRLKDIVPWHPDSPHKYSVVSELREKVTEEEAEKGMQGKLLDRVEGGVVISKLKVNVAENRFELNNEEFVPIGVLWQFFDQDGTLYRPRSLTHFQEYVRTLKEIGFNYIRFHQDVPTPAMAEIMQQEGMLFTIETANMQGNHENDVFIEALKNQARIAMEYLRLYSVWIPNLLNEIPLNFKEDLIHKAYDLAFSRADGRPIIAGSVENINEGAEAYKIIEQYVLKTGIKTIHEYSQNPKKVAENIRKAVSLWKGKAVVFVEELGGVGMLDSRNDETHWETCQGCELCSKVAEEAKESGKDGLIVNNGEKGGYGINPASRKQARERMESIIRAVLENGAAGLVWTQAICTGNEINGLFKLGKDGRLIPLLPLEDLRYLFKKLPEQIIQERKEKKRLESGIHTIFTAEQASFTTAA